jgi:glyoxylase-like metal-dependent hydrolase (beta-lactamase superfamily II)
MRVSDNLYLYLWENPRENNCNSVFIDGKVPTLIDPGLLSRTDDLFLRMKADDLDPDSIRLVLLTHCHPDHLEGIGAFTKSSVKKAISMKEYNFIEETAKPMLIQQGMGAPDYKFDLFLKQGDLTLGKHNLQVIETPGHSPGGICLYWPAQKVLVGGDLIFMQGVGRSDLPGGDEDQLKKSVERVSELDIDLLIPGHGPAVRGSDNVRANFDYIRMAFLGRFQ